MRASGLLVSRRGGEAGGCHGNPSVAAAAAALRDLHPEECQRANPQELTSLQTQRAICSSYIVSQQHKGWKEIAKPYDDDARSGANLLRPALQELLADIELGLVDVVVVYKLDRITRTLLDFVRLVDLFDRYGVVFVAITQNFDTSDSMGRLIRNVLLTFAQFEREIASDRIRDKKMLMKQRGLWTGGDAPIGYDLRRGKLVVNRHEEPAIRCIFETYVAAKRLAAVHQTLLERGFRRKVWKSSSGKVRGGGPIALSTLHHVLGNPIYIGEVSYRGERFPGIHEPIVDRMLWERVQEVLEERRLFKPKDPANLLTGFVHDGYGRRMNSRTGKNNFGGFRYYVSSPAAWATRQNIKVIRVQASELEDLVLEALKLFLSDRPRLRKALMDCRIFAPEVDQLGATGDGANVRLGRLTVRQLSCALRALLQRVEVYADIVRIVLRLEAIPLFLTWDGIGLFALSDVDLARARQMHVIDVTASLNRERRKQWLPVGPRRASAAVPNASLIALLDDAREAQQLIFANRDIAVADLAYSVGRKQAFFARLIRLNYLAPDIVAAILDGDQPAGLTRKRLMQFDLPPDWVLQRRILGFPRPTLSPPVEARPEN